MNRLKKSTLLGSLSERRTQSKSVSKTGETGKCRESRLIGAELKSQAKTAVGNSAGVAKAKW